MIVDRRLVVLGCSATKRKDRDYIPALERYDGSTYRVLRTFLRQSVWPSSLSIAVLSAKHGLIGGLAQIKDYDVRMTRGRAAEWRTDATSTLYDWRQRYDNVSLLLGKDYLDAVDRKLLKKQGVRTEVIEGGIGTKNGRLKRLLLNMDHQHRPQKPMPQVDRSLYFLPDWDDMLDRNFDFSADRFSSPNKHDRDEIHCTQLMGAERMCDGVLVSLGQHIGTNSKGVLKKFAKAHVRNLAPEPIREKFGLTDNQWLFGDCGAFSYVNELEPIITPERALAMYQLYGFDLGASVDHVPLPVLPADEQTRRITITRRNAARFIELHRKRRCSFKAVGVIQGTDAESYARQLGDYMKMGYNHIGIGALVPRSDKEILAIMQAVNKELATMKWEPWIHLFGVYRPKIQHLARQLGANSFDSATYFRKAWLRSGQNYLNTDGSWHAAIRVPMTSDPRTRKRLEASNLPLKKLERLERDTLRALHEYGNYRLPIEAVLDAIEAYDFLLARSEDHGSNLLSAYERTLADRPWEKCGCPICKQLGVDVVIFRGSNRNKRRGAHNTAMLYKRVVEGQEAAPASLF